MKVHMKMSPLKTPLSKVPPGSTQGSCTPG
jgi:hypothetical protein